jgi:nitrogen PTS system EIIA component
MEVEEFLAPENVVPRLVAKNKRQVLKMLAKRAEASLGLDGSELLRQLLDRENLGTTGIGSGIALPHCSMGFQPEFSNQSVFGFFAKLETEVDFEAIDGNKVDLVFMLIADTRSSALHLKAIAKLARLFRDPIMSEALRSATDRDLIYAILTGQSRSPD